MASKKDQFAVTRTYANKKTNKPTMIRFETQKLFNDWQNDKIDQSLGITLESDKEDLMFYFSCPENRDIWIQNNLRKKGRTI